MINSVVNKRCLKTCCAHMRQLKDGWMTQFIRNSGIVTKQLFLLQSRQRHHRTADGRS